MNADIPEREWLEAIDKIMREDGLTCHFIVGRDSSGASELCGQPAHIEIDKSSLDLYDTPKDHPVLTAFCDEHCVVWATANIRIGFCGIDVVLRCRNDFDV